MVTVNGSFYILFKRAWTGSGKSEHYNETESEDVRL